MQVEHGIISLSIMWNLYTKLSSWVMAQFAHWRLIMAVLAIWSSSKAKLSTVDCLEADRIDRIAAQVQRNCVSKLWKLSRSCSVCIEQCRHAQLNCGQHWLASDCITIALWLLYLFSFLYSLHLTRIIMNNPCHYWIPCQIRFNVSHMRCKIKHDKL